MAISQEGKLISFALTTTERQRGDLVRERFGLLDIQEERVNENVRLSFTTFVIQQ